MISKERLEEISSYFNDETNDEETQEWRDDLTSEECELITEWDDNYAKGVYRLCKAIIEAQARNSLSARLSL
ncbi:MAG: hypothetical protein FWG42_11725 [Clostridiales bacterium]|nr:hypothetical protein [Clostridiales bacterium]